MVNLIKVDFQNKSVVSKTYEESLLENKMAELQCRIKELLEDHKMLYDAAEEMTSMVFFKAAIASRRETLVGFYENEYDYLLKTIKDSE